jgi:acrylyl-CoA reductase (NADPH)
MAFGTAGLTAMLAVLALERNGSSAERLGSLPVVVTGATGGVGSLSIMILAALGYRALAVTGRLWESDYLQSIGASAVISRDDVAPRAAGPLAHERFGAAIDVVGGSMLAQIISQTARDGTVAVCGLVGGSGLASTVYPLILRGVTLAGINSTYPSDEAKTTAWRRLSAVSDRGMLDRIARAVPIRSVLAIAPAVLRGELRGRVILDVGSF